jgi:TRAP-type mannitol/chloroaromatic compound transport system permease small subunit
MPRVIKAYVRYVDAMNRAIGLGVMCMIFVMMGVLLYAAISRYFFNAPLLWAIETSQFLMAAYYLLGGAFSLQLGSHVRMDVLYERWSPRTQAAVDSVTALFLIFFLVLLLKGGWASTVYSWDTNQANYSAWAPRMWPIKAVMVIGIGLMLLQALSMLFKDLARALGREIA